MKRPQELPEAQTRFLKFFFAGTIPIYHEINDMENKLLKRG
jgi:hypothetical protein